MFDPCFSRGKRARPRRSARLANVSIPWRVVSQGLKGGMLHYRGHRITADVERTGADVLPTRL
eukprot:8754195-Pyramimonas_sp.AAC.1